MSRAVQSWIWTRPVHFVLGVHTGMHRFTTSVKIVLWAGPRRDWGLAHRTSALCVSVASVCVCVRGAWTLEWNTPELWARTISVCLFCGWTTLHPSTSTVFWCVKSTGKPAKFVFDWITFGFISLTHWGRVTHICVSKLSNIGSDNGLSPGRRQAIIWTNAGILLIGPFGTNFSEILTEIMTFWFKKMYSKVSSAKWRPFCLDLNVLNYMNYHGVPMRSNQYGYDLNNLTNVWGILMGS